YTRQPAGRLRRLTVAVLIDNVRNVGKDGKVTETPLSSEQLERVNQLVKDAVGFDESRGDNINVVNASFTQETPAANTAGGELEKAKIWESPLARDLAKIVAGLVVLLVLVLSVLRPLVRTLLEPVRNAPQMSARVVAETAATPATPLPPAQSAEAAHEQQIVQARGLVNQDPKRVAQVVRGWVAADE
ncbi:MAG: hypothetical protein JOZ12_04695, partial [Sinobacteraceae bacterium]|nr:hypothetical protein [Nevskiaceae bacterium]